MDELIVRLPAWGPFIFSDNFELGLHYLPKEDGNTAINLKGRFRHISNAELY